MAFAAMGVLVVGAVGALMARTPSAPPAPPIAPVSPPEPIPIPEPPRPKPPDAAIVSRLCDERGDADLAKVHAYLARRVTAHPSEQPVFTILLRDTAPGGCRARTKSTPNSVP